MMKITNLTLYKKLEINFIVVEYTEYIFECKFLKRTAKLKM